MHRFASVSSEAQRASHAFTFVASYGRRMTQKYEPPRLLLEVGRSVHAGLRVTPRAASGNAYCFVVTRKRPRPLGNNPKDFTAFKAFICKYRFGYVLLVVWALSFITKGKRGNKDKERKCEKEKGGAGVSKGFQACENTQYREKGDASTEQRKGRCFCLGPPSFPTEVRHQHRCCRIFHIRIHSSVF